MPTPVHGYKFRIPGTTIEVTLVTKGEGQGLRVKKGGVVYDIYLVQTTDPKATTIKVKHPTLGIMALREYAAFMIQKLLEETLTLTDSIYQKFVRTASDSFSFTDSVARTIGKLLEESLTFADSFTGRMWSTLTDALNLVDEAFKKYIVPVAEGFNFADAVGGLLSSIKTETLSLADSIAKKLGKTISETLSLADEVFKKYVRNPADSFSFADAVAGFFTSIKTETLSLGDTVTKKLKAVWEDSLSLADTITNRFKGLPSDAFSFTDSTLRLFQKSIGDSLSLADELFIGPLRKILEESLNLSDTFTGFMAGVKTEALTLADSLTQAFTALTTDAFSFGDSIIGFLATTKTETLSLADNSLKKFSKLLPPPVPTGGLVAEYEMDENEGGTIYDTSGQGNHGIISGALWVLGLVGWALGFDGNNDIVNLGTSLLNNPDAGTVCLWLFPTANGQSGAKPYWNTTILNKGWCYEALQQLSDNKIRIYFYDGIGWSWLDSVTSLTLNQWNCVIYAWDASGSTIYIAGLPDVESVIKTWADYHAGHFNQPLHLGGYTVESLPYYYEGPIDKVRFYTRRFNDNEAAQLTRRGRTRDSLRLKDSFVGFFSGALAEGLTLTDQLFIGPLRKILSETLSLADTLWEMFTGLAADAFSFGDSVIGLLAATKTETLSLEDSVSRKLSDSMIESLLLSDSIFTGKFRSMIADSVGVQDSVEQTKYYYIDYGDHNDIQIYDDSHNNSGHDDHGDYNDHKNTQIYDDAHGNQHGDDHGDYNDHGNRVIYDDYGPPYTDTYDDHLDYDDTHSDTHTDSPYEDTYNDHWDNHNDYSDTYSDHNDLDGPLYVDTYDDHWDNPDWTDVYNDASSGWVDGG